MRSKPGSESLATAPLEAEQAGVIEVLTECQWASARLADDLGRPSPGPGSSTRVAGSGGNHDQAVRACLDCAEICAATLGVLGRTRVWAGTLRAELFELCSRACDELVRHAWNIQVDSAAEAAAVAARCSDTCRRLAKSVDRSDSDDPGGL